MVPHIRTILGGFLFSGDDIDKPVRVLSGGERTRLAVARMLLRPANTLLLDEPTNHLDLDSKDVLLEALEDFGGTLIFVSHDRYFVDKLATKVIDIGARRRGRCIRELRGVPVESKRAAFDAPIAEGRWPMSRDPTAEAQRATLSKRWHDSEPRRIGPSDIGIDIGTSDRRRRPSHEEKKTAPTRGADGAKTRWKPGRRRISELEARIAAG